MFISNLPLTARVALLAANEAIKMYALISQPEILFENLRRVNRGTSRNEWISFLAHYRPFGNLARKDDYVVRVVLKRDFLKMGENNRFEADGFALVSHTGEVAKSYPFEITWSGTQDGPMVIFKREGVGLFPIF